jgi:acetyl esterase/lipase
MRVDATDEMIAEARAFNAALEELLAKTPPVHVIDPAVTRRARAEGTSFYGPVERLDHGHDRTIPGPGGDLALRIFVPERVDGVYLHLHGGGWTLGAADQQDPLLDNLAQRANVVAISVEYRLAPEHPFPAGPDDCEAAACWLVEHAAREFGTDRLVIGGESAGAHLAALTLLRLRDRHGAAGAFRGANLVFGAYDLGLTPSQRAWGTRNLVLSTPIMEWFYECFAPGLTAEERRDPAISPLWAELHDLPPALFTVGELDPLLDDSLFMAARWAAAGNEAELLVYPESIHAFNAFPSALARHAVRAQRDFVRRALAG